MEPLGRLFDRLEGCRQGVAEWEPVYNEFVARLHRLGTGEAAPKLRETFPDFALPNSRGLHVSLYDLLDAGPLVLSFNRGGWCPYCRSELRAWAEALPRLHALGGRFACVTGEVGGRAERMRRELDLHAELFCDVDHGVALSLGLAFPLETGLRRRYLACGLDLSEAYGSASWFLPIPATYVLDRAGTVCFAHADPDFRIRAEPYDVLRVVEILQKQH